jgi:hypothetical protein
MDRKTKWDEWRHKWCYHNFLEVLNCLADPSTAAFHRPSWNKIDRHDEELHPAIERIKHLRDLGLTSKQVVTNFLAL